MKERVLVLLTDPYRRAWLFLVAVIVTILTTAYGALSYFHTHMLLRAGESLAMVAADTASDLDRTLYERYGDSHIMARALSTQTKNLSYLKDYVEWIYEAYSPFYQSIEVSDGAGRVIASTARETIGQDRSTAIWFSAAPRDGTILVQDIASDTEINAARVISFTIAILNQAGQFQGFVTSHIDVPALASIVKTRDKAVKTSLELSQDLQYVFVAHNGKIVVSIPELDSSNDKFPLTQDLLRLNSPTYEADPWFQFPAPTVTGYAPTQGYGNFPGMGWTVVIRASEKELLAPIWKVTSILALAASGVLLPMFAALFWTARRLKEREIQLREQRAHLAALASQLSSTEEQERKRLAVDLHDNLAQLLIVLKMKLHRHGEMEDVMDYVNQAVVYTRNLISDLRPPVFGDKSDLQAAVAWVVKKMERHGLAVTVVDEAGPTPRPEELVTVVYQTVQELLFNVLKHGQTKEASLFLRRSLNALEVVVLDRGKGFDVSQEFMPSKEGGFGLINIRERIEDLGGNLTVSSTPGGGTCVAFSLPLTGLQ